MSTTTANLGLVKPEYSDTADVQEINQNMDKVDGAVGAAQNSFGILADGNTHAAILVGQFVYVRNHSSLPDGLYSAITTIPANGALSASNLTAEPGGGLNALNGKLSGYVKYIEVPLSAAIVGDEWGPESRSIGTTQNLLMLNGNQIVSLSFKDVAFYQNAMPLAAVYNGNVYVSATQHAYLYSQSVTLVVGYHD